jgi:hypothetical protein
MNGDITLNDPEFGCLSRVQYGHGLASNWQRILPIEFSPVNLRCTLNYVFDAEFSELPGGYTEPPSLNIEDSFGKGPSSSQVEAWRTYCANKEHIFSEAQKKLNVLILNSIEEEKNRLITSGRDAYFNLEIERLGLLSFDGVAKQVQLSDFTLFERAKDGLAYSMLSFLWTWDEEHRASILLHGTNLIDGFVSDGSLVDLEKM